MHANLKLLAASTNSVDDNARLMSVLPVATSIAKPVAVFMTGHFLLKVSESGTSIWRLLQKMVHGPKQPAVALRSSFA